jgi:DNA mismatch repair ATPase MutS
MKIRLLFPDRDFDWSAPLPWNEPALREDLALDELLAAMAREDQHILGVANKVVLSGVFGDIDTIRHRQAVLQDCLKNRTVLRDLYALATEAADKSKRSYLGSLTRYPHWVLSDSIDQMEIYVTYMKRLRMTAEQHADKFSSAGWGELFTMLKGELDDAYLARISNALRRLKSRDVTKIGAALGEGNKPDGFILHRPPLTNLDRCRSLWAWIFAPKAPPNSFSIHPRDEAGHRALERLRDQGLAYVANALAQSKDHVRNFFDLMRLELGFYVGCVNLHETLAARKEPACLPDPQPRENRCLTFRSLYDVGLSLTIKSNAVGNSVGADGKSLVVVTGANQGGKSTFLRSVGIAQLMMQSGMFVPAERFSASVCNSVFTHYKREEDAGMISGKFDEELRRMNEIVDHCRSHS